MYLILNPKSQNTYIIIKFLSYLSNIKMNFNRKILARMENEDAWETCVSNYIGTC